MKDTTSHGIEIKRLSHNEDFYSNVFKRVEKIVSVLFYIVSHIDQKDKDHLHTDRIKDKALATHEISLKTLELQDHNRVSGLESLQYALLQLDSTLRVAAAAAVVPQDLLLLATEQIDGVQRYLNHHYTQSNSFMYSAGDTAVPRSESKATVTKAAPTRAARPKKVSIPAGDISSDAYLVYSQLTDRAERIKTVLEAKPRASVKDIAEVITDVSEKTIQRELNSLIEKGQVVREGERRWSRYSVAK
jgi:hypothetical protein